MYQVFIVEDELLIRQSIRSVIEGMSGPYAFCGEASDGEMALAMMQDLMPDIVVTDIRMPFLDGFELIRHAKAMMPWLKIVILSGYGDFESAQKAITLGVDQYLLKPVRAEDLRRVIEEMGRQLEDSKAKTMLPHGFDQDEVQIALRQHFMQQLLYGGADTAALLGRARSLGLDIVRAHYQLILLRLDSEEIDYQLTHNVTQNILEQMQLSLYCFNEVNQLTILSYDNDRESLIERSYQLINIFKHEIKDVCPMITAVVSSVMQRLSAVSPAYQAATNLLKRVDVVSAGQVIDVNDTAQVTADIVSFHGSFSEAFWQKLQHATAQEIPALLEEEVSASETLKFGSMLMRYHALIDLLKMTVQIIVRSSPGAEAKDIATQLSSQYDIFTASGHMESFMSTATELLQRAVSMKQDNLSDMKYTHVISRAKKYIAENFCNPNISLISVAKHVGMSSAHFSTVFSQTMGRSFINYLTAMRIERAKELLAATDMKLSAIAMEIGYNEPNYFSHVFRKLEGITPKEYRNRAASRGDQ